MVAQQPERPALREDGRVLIDRPIFETKDQVVRDAITMGVLRHLTVGNGLSVKGLQHQEAMHQPLCVAYRYGICW